MTITFLKHFFVPAFWAVVIDSNITLARTAPGVPVQKPRQTYTIREDIWVQVEGRTINCGLVSESSYRIFRLFPFPSLYLSKIHCFSKRNRIYPKKGAKQYTRKVRKNFPSQTFFQILQCRLQGKLRHSTIDKNSQPHQICMKYKKLSFVSFPASKAISRPINYLRTSVRLCIRMFLPNKIN